MGMGVDFRYLETLEIKLSEQNRLQNRINELEARLRELDPALNKSRSGSVQQFMTPPETVSASLSQPAYVSPTIESHSPHYPSYTDDRYSEIRSQVAIAGADQEANTDPGVFEADDAGKGWYLGSASGSTPSCATMLTLVVYMNSIKNTASSGHTILSHLTQSWA